jgi:integrase/recombinase XerD
MKLLTKLGSQKKSGLCPVYVICYLKNERIRFLTGVEVYANEFNENTGLMIGKAVTNKDKQLLIDNSKKRITQIQVNYKLQTKELTPYDLRREYETPAVYIDFIKYFENELEHRKKIVELATYKQNMAVLTKLKTFKPAILFHEVDEDFINSFRAYCRKLGNCPSTVEKNITTLKIIVLKAYRKKLIEVNPFEDSKIKTFESDRIFLEPNEFSILLDFYRRGLFEPKIRKTLKPFLFCCFTGLRVSDVKRIKKSDIVGNTIVIMPQKTKRFMKIIKVPLCNSALEFIDLPIKQTYLFSMNCEQNMNKHLKEVADLCGIEKQITFHSSRHTFATNYLRTTNDLSGLQKLLGHSSIKQTQVYAHILDTDTQANILKLDIDYQQPQIAI